MHSSSMSTHLSSNSSPSSEYSALPDCIWDASPLLAFRINPAQKIVDGNAAMQAAITNKMAFYPGKSLMTWMGRDNMEAFHQWSELYLSGQPTRPLPLTIQHLAFPLILVEVFKIDDTLVVRSIPDQQSESTAIQSEATIQFFQELRGSISHDLRAPIRQLRVYTQKILADTRLAVSEELAQELEFLNEFSGNLLQRFNSLATLIENEAKAITPTSVDLEQLLRHESSNYTLQLEHSQGAISVDELPTIIGDEELLGQIVRELLDNAIAHIPADRSPAISVTSKQYEAGTVIAFQDNGVGFDNQIAPKLFSAYSSIHEESVVPQTGTGMGLTIAKRLAERMGIGLTASGVIDQGATFYLEIPQHLILQ